MRLFDTVERHDEGPAGYREPHFTYLNRSARPEVDRIREVLESWFARYPTQAQPDLGARFRSKSDPQYESAFFELFLHELLNRLGCRVRVHPKPAGGRATRPDFLVKSATGVRFYLEAAIATGESEAEAAQRSRVNVVYDALDRLNSPNFFIGVKVRGALRTAPPARDIRSFVARHLASLDPDEVAAYQRSTGRRTGPEWHYEHPGWRITFFPIPKRPEARGKPGVRPVGIRFGEPRYVDPRVRIRDAILVKARRYGDLNLPYLIALNALVWPVRQSEALEALFGGVQVIVRWGPSGMATPEPTRVPDGVWTSYSGARYRRVSAVLLATRLSPWNLPMADICLYLNPRAKRPYSSELTRLPHAAVQNEQVEWRGGDSLGGILELPAAWPMKLDR